MNDTALRPTRERAFRLRLFPSVPRLCIGALLAAVFLAAAMQCGASIGATAVLTALLLMGSMVGISCGARLCKALNWAWLLLACPTGLVLTQRMLNCDLSCLGAAHIALGLLCLSVPMLLVLACSGSFRAAVIAGLLLPMALAAGNYFVYRLRGSELTAQDFSALGTALAVAGRYSLSFDAPFAYAWAACAAYLLLGFSLPAHRLARATRLATALAAVTATVALYFGMANVPSLAYQAQGTTYNGFVLNFLCRMRTLRVEQPQDYDPAAIDALAAHYASDDEPTQTPHVLIVMNESFADLRVLGALHTDVSPTPFYDSLLSQTIHGYTLGMTLGGGTSTAEYQLLTGHSAAFLPEGSYPFTEYLSADSDSLLASFSRMGYTTAVVHPASGRNWMRETVYTRLGADALYFEEDFAEAARVRGLVADAAVYDRMLSLLEDARGTPALLLGITMQNHGGYSLAWEAGADSVHLRGYRGTYPEAEQYLSLLHSSDAALQTLIERLQAWDEPVIVLFFGDHQPALSEEFYLELHGGAFETLPEQMTRYLTPFFLWANFPIAAREVGVVGQSFLANELLLAADLPLSPYRAFLQQVRSCIPAMNALGYYSARQGTFLPYTSTEGDEAQQLAQYRALQYNAIFDAENRSSVFFPAARP